MIRQLLRAQALVCLAPFAAATDFVVAPSGGDFDTIQGALDAAFAGDRILVQDKPGGYRERLIFPRSGNASAGPIELLAAPGHSPALDGTGVSGIWMITLQDRSYVTIRGLEIRNNLGVINDGSGIRIQGQGSHVEIRDNVIHDMRGFGAMAITVYGTSTSGSIADLVIDGNLVYDCEPADSEAITLNGNVERFEVTRNVVRDVNNIGIDFIGGESDINPSFVARDGVCRENVVVRANANYGGGYAGGIYVDGGKDILIERNTVIGCDLGIEVGAENAGLTTSGVVVRNNLVYHNEKVGIVLGGYDSTVGRVEDCDFVHNLCFENDLLQDGNGELWIQYGNGNRISGNLFICGPQGVLLANYNGTSGNQLGDNLWFSTAGGQPTFVWNGVGSSGLSAFQSASGQGSGSIYADPLLRSPFGPDGLAGTLDEDFRVLPGSPAIDAGNNGGAAGSIEDFFGLPRFADDPDAPDTGTGSGALVDLGPHEHHALSAANRSISVSAGGTQALELDAGSARAGAFYALGLSYSGALPGLPLGAVVLPLNYDLLVQATWSNPNSGVVLGFQGFLDGSGEAQASVNLTAGSVSSGVGLELNSAFLLYDAASGFTFASNAMPLELAP